MTADTHIPVEAKSIYSSADLSQIHLDRVPKHIAIVMDGNRRWAQERGLASVMGHWKGSEVIDDLMRAASELGVETVTLYTFSTENWARSKPEIEALMDIFEFNLIRKRQGMIKDGIRLDTIGDLSRLPKRVQDALQQTKCATEKCDKINLVLAMNYGSRDEIRRAVLQILEQNERQKIDPKEITEEFIARHLDTKPWGDPELLIRTSGELRLSNFLLWQISYAEIYVTDVLWPDFSPKELLHAVISYQERSRRLGG
jgi:undecaprenyl diphosphate synthase